MSVIAVAGGTGTIGRHIVSELRAAGQEARVLSRSSPEYRVDLQTGAGLAGALAGCDVVVDAANGSPRRPEPVVVEGSRRLLAAAAQAGVGHVVCVSIVGCDRVPTRYYRAKVAQEEAVRQAAIPWTIVRSTQFHELVDGVLGRLGRWRLHPAARMRLQPVSAAEAAAVVAAAARREAAGMTSVGGPEVLDLRELAALWQRHNGRRTWPLPIGLPPRLSRPLAAGCLTCATPDHRTPTRYDQWLRGRS